jgi:hypothetical protein
VAAAASALASAAPCDASADVVPPSAEVAVHRPAALHASPAWQLPQDPPHSSDPQALPEQFGAHVDFFSHFFA